MEYDLLDAFQNQSTIEFEEHYANNSELINSDFNESFTVCMESVSFNTTLNVVEDFIHHFTREKFQSFLNCFYEVSKIFFFT